MGKQICPIHKLFFPVGGVCPQCRNEGLDVHYIEKNLASSEVKNLAGEKELNLIATKPDYGTWPKKLMQKNKTGLINTTHVEYILKNFFPHDISLLKDFLEKIMVPVEIESVTEINLDRGLKEYKYEAFLPSTPPKFWKDYETPVGELTGSLPESNIKFKKE